VSGRLLDMEGVLHKDNVGCLFDPIIALQTLSTLLHPCICYQNSNLIGLHCCRSIRCHWPSDKKSVS